MIMVPIDPNEIEETSSIPTLHHSNKTMVECLKQFKASRTEVTRGGKTHHEWTADIGTYSTLVIPHDEVIGLREDINCELFASKKELAIIAVSSTRLFVMVFGNEKDYEDQIRYQRSKL